MNVRYETAYGVFEWDSEKDASNKQKHGIGFALASEAFADIDALFLADIAHSKGELRQKILGKVGNMSLLLVVFTERSVTRIISARKATKKEVDFYVQHNYERCTGART
ncbi:MAG: BrnT family toxin [Desulfovibrio sp.]|nr:BrnT family toxin [Desulfovibrio sp.]